MSFAKRAKHANPAHAHWISFSLSDGVRDRLNALVADRNVPQKHVWRARIVLLSADGLGTNAIMAGTGKSKTCVWRWQERFMNAGVDGLLRGKTRQAPCRCRPDDGGGAADAGAAAT